MTRYGRLRAYFAGSVATALLGAASFVSSSPATAAPCTGPGAPATTQTKCLTAVTIPGNPLRSFDISWVNPQRAEYYLGDRSNSGIDIIDTQHLKFKRTIGGFVGIKLKSDGSVDNNHSGPDGVASHGRWLYAGDGDSTLKVIDLDAPTASAIKQSISTGGTTRLDEMALTTDGNLLLAANNAEDPPFATLFAANGDRATSNVSKIIKITIDLTIVPKAGLSIEQPAWDPTTKRFYTSIPIIANNPPGCNFDGAAGPITCHGGVLVTDPHNPKAVEGAFDPATHTGVVKLAACGPNGATVGVDDELMLGCTPRNNPSDTQTTIFSARTTQSVSVNGVTGSDEVFFNAGDRRYYLGASANPAGAVLGVVDAETKFFIESVPQSTGSHSVATDSERNLIFVPQVAPKAVVGAGGDTTTVGAGICGGNSGCIGVYKHNVEDDDDQGDR
ncbi:MAG TPA: hypothetical protein VKC66_10055 [Xanthobacteraceae bacterium]|nr:hypothetical protein [Xanthobacteraceae bacterium]